MKTLRILALLFCSAVCLGLASCSDDNDEEIGSSNDLIGTWDFVSSSGWEKEDGEIIDRWEDEEEDGLRVIFYDDGTYESAEWYRGEWDYYDEGEWSLRGNKIYTIDEDGEESAATIKTLTSSKLVVEGTEKEVYDGIVYEYYSVETYRKVSK